MEVVQALQNLGLAEEEAKTYDLLVSLGSATVGKISTMSPLSRTKLYATMDKLLKKGWIKTIADKPLTYAAIHPAQVLKDHEKNVILSREIAIKGLHEKFNAPPKETTSAVTYRGLGVIKQLERMILESNKRVDLIVNHLPSEVMENIFANLEKASKRGVNVRAILGTGLSKFAVKKKNMEVVSSDIPDVGIFMTDQFIMLGSANAETIHELPEGLSGILTQDAGLLQFGELTFKQLLRGAKMEVDYEIKAFPASKKDSKDRLGLKKNLESLEKKEK